MEQVQIDKFSESTDPYIKEIYEYISKSAQVGTIAGDSSTPLVQFRAADVDALSQIGFEHVKSNYVAHGQHFESLQEARNNTYLRIAGDALINNQNGVGTMLDPSVYTHSQIPVMMGPYEGSSVYAPGGLPAQIIDKKSRGMVTQGATFKPADKIFWDTDKIETLEEAALSTGFNDAINDAVADSYIYGGSILYPVFKGDTPTTYMKDIDSLKLGKNCIERWVHTDRWNTVIVPSYIVTAADYLRPKSLLIPQSALEVNTSRMAIIKPKAVPYWVALYNIGWAPSDFSGWLRAYFGYEITCQSIPVMAQQMSLILYRMPLDGLNATIGPDKVKDLMKINEEQMKNWSALSPKAVNMVGEVEVVDRTYSGFEQFVGAMKSDLAAQCGVPEPSLWHTPNKGFSDNTTESLLKQSETLQMGQSFLERSMGPATDALIAHVYGKDSEEWKNRRLVRMSFNKPVVSTEKDRAEVGARFAASVSSFCQAGVSPDIALKLSSQFFPSVKITEEMIDSAKDSYEQRLAKNDLDGQLGGGTGNNMSSSSGKTTGAYTKPKTK